MAFRGPRLVNLVLALATVLACIVVLLTPAGVSAVTLPAGFQQTDVLPGVGKPQDVAIAPNGRVFVAEKTGFIRTYDNIDDPTPTLFGDLRTQVHNFSGRGLLSIVADPGFPAKPFVYVYYNMDAPLGGTPPVYGGGSFDPCPKADTVGDVPDLGALDNCPVGSRVSRLTVSGETMSAEKVLVEDFCQQFAGHGGGGLAFGTDGKLYASGSDGSTSLFWDYGQRGSPKNPCGDPPGGVGADLTPPTSEGGRLRAQDVRTTADPTGLAGSLIRIDSPATMTTKIDPATNASRIVAFGLRDATRLEVRPGSANDLWVADRGGGYWEELHRVTPSSGKVNFGWPCYENNAPRKRSDEQGLSLCESLYSGGGATSAFWAYDHELPVHASENCEKDSLGSPPGSTLSGLEFYPAAGGTFPPMYRNALFFADRLRSCIWALLPDASSGGVPKKGNVVPFAGMATRATDLEVTPQGDLLYIDQRDDIVRRIRYIVANTPPVADATSDVAGGPNPLTVKFSGLGSTDADPGETLTYAWDLDGDNLLDDSTAAQPAFTYEMPGTYTVTLKVTDSKLASSTDTVTITVSDSGLRTLRFSPVADARVELANSGTNYGTSNKLRTDGNPKVESLLRFNVTGIDGIVQSAKLKLRALADGTADGPTLHSAAAGWTETGVKWSNRPAFAAELGDKAAIAPNALVEYDVKSLVGANGEVNVGLRQLSDDSLELASREDLDAAKRPVLELVVAPRPPDPTPDPTPDPKVDPKTGPFLSVPDLKVTPVKPLTNPVLALAVAGTQRVLAKKAIVVHGSCAASCTLKASATVTLAGASRALKLRAVTRSAASGKQVRLRLKLSGKTMRAVRRALRQGNRVSATVTVVATDPSGGTTTAKRKIRLKR